MHVRELFDLSDRVALVTGGYGIFGRPITEALAEAGAHVVVAARDLERSQQWAQVLLAHSHQASAEQFDQSQENSILSLRDRLLSRFGRIDIVVNNSVGRAMRSYGDDLQAWRASMDVNATGLFCIGRAFLDAMMQCGRGSMINIGSIQSVAAPRFANYQGTDITTPPDYHFHKHGLLGLTKYLAALAGPRGVRVNAISPGGFNPQGFSEPFLSQYLRNCFLPRMVEHDDIKGAIVFLASDASSYITGQNIVMDGGYTA